MPPFKDLTGKVFNRITVRSRAPNQGKNVSWNCVCSCGTEFVTQGGSLTSEHTKSCGCFMKENTSKLGLTHPAKKHGMSFSSTYYSWRAMKLRCNRVKDISYKWYGAKGIKVCDRWLKFKNFLEDMGVKPSKDYCIDRVDSSKDYEPSNCVWITKTDNANKVNQLIKQNKGIGI